MEDTRFIVLWRKADPMRVLEWDFHTCEDLEEVERTVKGLVAQGVHQYSTLVLGPKLPEYSSAY